MSKKIKLNLDELKVESFVTTLSDEEKNNIKGGRTQMGECSRDNCLVI
jgi:hypothetical protein